MFELLQPTHLLFVLVVALVVLGPKRLAETSRSLGRTLQEFKVYKDDLKEGLLGTTSHESEPEEERTSKKAVEERERKG